ncbi:hypothetical protein [Streptomyces sp. RPT161]|uniref:hypothetical protein n=1 Tax=Streptomyces sp. RPT161 TaxID=3015993 RepID=UPI0022B9325D|nr:hypothetical protein [Streptomyces sp. RPT161]
MLDLIGVSWPNVDEDDYHHTADSLRDFAHDLDDNAGAANQHMQRLLASGRGQSMEALSAHWGKVKDKHLKDLATAATVIAGALDLAAGAITAQKGEAITQLGYLADETGIALALIPETGGLSALLDAGAIEATQQVVKQLFKEVARDAVSYIVSALTEPAVSALDGMAIDLAIQLAADGMGVQDGVNLNEVKQAGKEGLHQGVGSAKAALRLDSVGGGDGGGGGGSADDVFIDHAEHERASTHLNVVGASVRGKTSGHIIKARLRLGRTRGKGEIAKVIEQIAEKAINAVEKAATELGDHLKDRLPKAVRQISKDFRNTDQDIKDGFVSGASMDVQIQPHVAVGPFQLGMPFSEAMEIAQGLGRISHQPGAEQPPGVYVVNLDDTAFQFVLSFPQTGTLTSVELWRFRVEDADINVIFDGLDVFRTPSEQLVPQLEERGHSVVYDDDFGIYALPESRMSFANNSSYEYPVDAEGDPLYFDYVLVTTQPVR